MRNWLNYHHLYYFWIISQELSISAAASRLRLAQPTLSAQLKQLEESFECKLFERTGKALKLTPEGNLVLRYAESIFTLGQELQSILDGGSPISTFVFRVGISDSLPKLVAQRTLLPIVTLEKEMKLQCFEGKREALLTQLGGHELDLVLTDAPFSSEVAVKAYNHLLGSSDIALFGTEALISTLSGKGLDQLRQAPYILPTQNTMIRRAMDTWFEQSGIAPHIVAEFEDSALLKAFGSEGVGLFPIASAIAEEVERTYSVKQLTVLEGVKEEFYAISLERKVTHPAMITITEAARRGFGGS